MSRSSDDGSSRVTAILRVISPRFMSLVGLLLTYLTSQFNLQTLQVTQPKHNQPAMKLETQPIRHDPNTMGWAAESKGLMLSLSAIAWLSVAVRAFISHRRFGQSFEYQSRFIMTLKPFVILFSKRHFHPQYIISHHRLTHTDCQHRPLLTQLKRLSYYTDLL